MSLSRIRTKEDTDQVTGRLFKCNKDLGIVFDKDCIATDEKPVFETGKPKGYRAENFNNNAFHLTMPKVSIRRVRMKK